MGGETVTEPQPKHMMKRILLLLLPVLAFAATGTDPTDRKSKEEALGDLWQESLNKESSDPDAALKLASDYAKGGGDAYLATMRAAWLNYGQKKYEEAARHYTNAAKLQPGALSPRLGLLTVAQEKGDLAAGVKAGELVLGLEPTNYRALMAVAWGSFQVKDYTKAGSAYRRVMGLYPEDMDALSGAGWCAFYKGQKVEARSCFRRLLSVNPNYQYAKQGLEATKL
jgi:tetratricopeptide (TPR) repeat protein